MNNETMKRYEAMLDAPDRETRLAGVRGLKEAIAAGTIPAVAAGGDVNNHVHTTYSFSPYSPSAAVWQAYRAGLRTVGIMDHDSISGAREFLEAADVLGVLATIGTECRVSMARTPLAGRRFNNPDQEDNVYMALHGIPHPQIDRVAAFFKPLTEARGRRNRAMTEKINLLAAPMDIRLDYDADVLPLSMHAEGGSVTERHILFALAKKLTAAYGRGPALVEALRTRFGMTLPAKLEGYLTDAGNDCYEYDLLGALKGGLVEKFYIPATDECPPVQDLLAFGREIGAITAYAYLGDVGDSVTGDKKAQEFEDGYLDELFALLRELGFNAVTYMPSRNTPEQLARLRALCAEYGFFQISGEDINTPRQSFICYAQRAPEFANLYEATMALIGHERAASADPGRAMFCDAAVRAAPRLEERIKMYAQMIEDA